MCMSANRMAGQWRMYTCSVLEIDEPSSGMVLGPDFVRIFRFL